MALVSKSTKAQIDVVSAQHAQQIAGNLYAGEALGTIAPCRIHTDGLVYMSNATAANAEAQIDGWTPRAYAVGEAVTLFGRGVRAKYSDGSLTPGQTLYIHTVDGQLNDTATTGDPTGVARAINTEDIRFIRDS